MWALLVRLTRWLVPGAPDVCNRISVLRVLSMCLTRTLILLFELPWLNSCVGTMWALPNISRLFGVSNLGRLWKMWLLSVLWWVLVISRWSVSCLVSGRRVTSLGGSLQWKLESRTW